MSVAVLLFANISSFEEHWKTLFYIRAVWRTDQFRRSEQFGTTEPSVAREAEQVPRRGFSFEESMCESCWSGISRDGVALCNSGSTSLEISTLWDTRDAVHTYTAPRSMSFLRGSLVWNPPEEDTPQNSASRPTKTHETYGRKQIF